MVYFIFLQILPCMKISSGVVKIITLLDVELKMYSQLIGRLDLFFTLFLRIDSLLLCF